jgi:hypothetical protein
MPNCRNPTSDSVVTMARRKVLMLTNCELGQANIFIATSHALLEQDPNVELHIASFPQL